MLPIALQGSQSQHKAYSRPGMPPRFQKQHSGGDQQGVTSPRSQPPHSPQSSQATPTSPQPHPGAQMRPGQGPPTSWGAPYWNPMQQFMGYGPRPPMDMQGMHMYPGMPPRRTRTDSHGSGTESQEERDSRAASYQQQQQQQYEEAMR
ncbi:protein PRRC2A-like [Dreissena polymorpha]|uniref:Uncharacterized protein n=1 Tax=Dreissena polymorpha TaxID=45954 RepID=A0A9D4FW59_DREPO|nr:protein PRRC2A-like [Dreissena polymorpha]KAH3805557.1 hypothetical protein DPMN_133861 [Dreissena polymorpha]